MDTISLDRIKTDIIYYLDTATDHITNASPPLAARLSLERAAALLVYVQDETLGNRYQSLDREVILAMLPAKARDVFHPYPPQN